MYRGAEAAVNARGLPVEPVRDLDEEGVERGRVEEHAHVAAERPRALRAGEFLPPLGPDGVDRRSGFVLPAQHDIGAELLDVELPRAVGDARVDVRGVARAVGGRPRGERAFGARDTGKATPRWSPCPCAHGGGTGDWRPAGPPRVQRSEYVAPSWPTVPPVCRYQLLRNSTCRLVFSACSSIKPPALVQSCHSLKFHRSCWYQDVGWRNCRPTHVAWSCQSARRRKPRSLTP